MIILGDSHTPVILRGARHIGLELTGAMVAPANVFNRPFFNNADRVIITSPIIVEQIELRRLRWPKERGQLVFCAGLACNHFYGPMARNRVNFGNDYHDPMAQYVSAAMMAQMIEDAQCHLVRFYTSLLDEGLLAAVVAGPPPQARHRASLYYGDRILDLCAMFQAPIRTALTGRCPIIEPAEIVDQKGFLKEEFWGPDWSHANEAFGALVATQLRRLL